MGYVLAAVGTLIAGSLIWISITDANSRATNSQHEVGVMEIAVARYRNQIAATDGIGALNGDPTVAQLLGGNEVPDQGAPPLISFRIGDLQLTCTDPTGAGHYRCAEHKVPTPPTSTAAKK